MESAPKGADPEVEKVESATHDAQEKSKKVDKDFAKEVSCSEFRSNTCRC